MIRSEFKIRYLIWFLFLLAGILFFAWLLVLSVRWIIEDGVMGNFLWFILFGVMLFAVLLVLKDFKYIRIDPESKTMFWYSICRPWGKSISLTDYEGVIRSKEYGILGDVETVYIVDKNMVASIKMNSLYYKNFNALFSALALKEIKKYDFDFWKYIKLIVTGRLKIETK